MLPYGGLRLWMQKVNLTSLAFCFFVYNLYLHCLGSGEDAEAMEGLVSKEHMKPSVNDVKVPDHVE